MVLPKQGRTVCKLLNPTNSSIFLKRRPTIAVINKLSIDSINVIDNFNRSSLTNDEQEAETVTMVEAEIVEESDSPWSSPCLLIKKSGVNEYRFVNDLRAVNKLTKPVYWPMPTMTDIFDTVAENNPSIFSNIDLKNAYRSIQIKLTEDSKPKTAFTVGGKKLPISPHGYGFK